MTPIRFAAIPGLLLALALPAVAAEMQQGQAPPFAARDIDGNRFDLAEQMEQGPVAITFWATWCKPCRKELPELAKLQRRYAGAGFAVVAVSGDSPVDAAKIRPYVKSARFPFVVVHDVDGEVRRRFEVEAFPTTFLVDRAGNVVHRQVGYRRGDEAILERALRELLPGTLPPPEHPEPDAESLGR